MSEEHTQNNQQMIVIGLAVIAALLVAIIGVMIWQQNRIPGPDAAAIQAGQAAQQQAPAGMGAPGGATGQAPAGMPGGTPGAAAGAPTEFDAKTATKLPAGMTPEQALKTYNEDVIGGKFEEAYKLLPADKQASYGDPKAYAEQVKAYGITSYELGKAVTKGDTVTITSTQVTPQMPIGYTWTYKKVGDTWFVASRTMGGQ